MQCPPYLLLRFGTYSVDQAINAGLDLEMPGPPRWRTPLLVGHALSCQKLREETLDVRAQAMLEFVQRQAQRNPDVVFGDGQERTRDTPEGRAFCRRLAAEGMVVLKNTGGVLPLAPGRVKKVALIGPNMKDRVISGGGSAALKPSYVVTPFTGITQNAPEGIEFGYELGCYCGFLLFSAWGHRSANIETCSVQVHADDRGIPHDAYRRTGLGVHILQ